MKSEKVENVINHENGENHEKHRKCCFSIKWVFFAVFIKNLVTIDDYRATAFVQKSQKR
jgi:hypothetical protein